MSPGPTSLLAPPAPPVGTRRVGATPRHAAPPPPTTRSGRTPRTGPPSHHGFGFRPELEGLRAVAVLAVVLYHAGVPVLPGGYVGVDVFFVLSGYLITGLMLAEVGRTGRLSLRRFYARRIRRLLPAAVLVLSVVAAVASVVLPAVHRATAAGDILAAALYVSNWRFAAQATDYLAADDAPSPVLHYWSLGIEEQFYVLWPLLVVACLLVLRRLGRTAALRAVLGRTIVTLAVVSLVAGAVLTASNQSLAFFNTFTRIWELAAGAAVAVVGRRVLMLTHGARAGLAWLGLLAIVWAVLGYDDAVAYPGWAALAPVLGTAAVIVGCSARTAAPPPGPARLLSAGWMRHVGRISYSWYLWHWPVLVLPVAALGRPLTAVEAALAVAGSYLLSVASYHLVEQVMRYAPVLQPVRAAMLLGAVLTVVAVVAAAGLARSGDDGAERTGLTSGTEQVGEGVFEVAPEVTVDLDSGKVSAPAKLTPSPGEAPDDVFQKLYGNNCQAALLATEVVDCVMGKASSKTTMLVFGDSHAAAWAPALDILAVTRGWRMVPMTKAGCSAALFPVWNPQLDRHTPECDQWRQNALARIDELRPDIVVVANRWNYRVADTSGDGTAQVTGPAAQQIVAEGTAAMVERLARTGARVVFLRDVPAPGFDGPACVSKHGKDYAACDFSRAETWPRDELITAAVQQAADDVHVVDLVGQVCPPAGDTCPVVAGNILRYRDTNHMTATYARSLAPALVDVFPAAP